MDLFWLGVRDPPPKNKLKKIASPLVRCMLSIGLQLCVGDSDLEVYSGYMVLRSLSN